MRELAVSCAREVVPAADERKQRKPSVNDASQESVAPKLRRQFTASEKLRLVKAADAALASGERGALEALLRKEAIYSSFWSEVKRYLPDYDDRRRRLRALGPTLEWLGANGARSDAPKTAI